MSTEIFLVRHGEVENPEDRFYGREWDIELSESGREQIAELGDSLKEAGVEPAVIYTSPLRRTKESAEILAAVFPEAEVVEDERLLETETKGLVGKRQDWVRGLGDLYNYEGALQFEIEPQEGVLARMREVVEEIKERYIGRVVLVVGHGDPLAFLIWDVLHPEKPIAPIQEIKRAGLYLDKGGVRHFRFTNEEVLETHIC